MKCPPGRRTRIFFLERHLCSQMRRAVVPLRESSRLRANFPQQLDRPIQALWPFSRRSLLSCRPQAKITLPPTGAKSLNAPAVPLRHAAKHLFLRPRAGHDVMASPWRPTGGWRTNVSEWLGRGTHAGMHPSRHSLLSATLEIAIVRMTRARHALRHARTNSLRDLAP
jgi:hypothetical protein